SRSTLTKIRWIKKHSNIFSVTHLCHVLKVSRSLYYYHVKEKYSVRNERLKYFKVLIKALYHQYNGIYGAPKIHAFFTQKGYMVSVKYVQKIMRLLGIASVTIKKFKHYTNAKVKGVFNNILNQNFLLHNPTRNGFQTLLIFKLSSTDGAI
ncbi:IS3 family transposase, partial [Staphylococcus equorum]|uniref:IS3 family transposase n=1 Tax=Staphylococcus equorum TaxID=246432 RepID=UPI003EBFB538